MARPFPALSILLVLGCSPAAPPPAEPPAPVGAAAYRKVLRVEGGVDLAPRELAARAAADAARIAERMDRLAAGIGPERSTKRSTGSPAGEGGWRAAFRRLRADHPPDAEAVLAAYREEVERARRFVVARELVSLPPGRLEVARTPAFLERRYPLTAYLGYRLAVTVGEGDRPADHCRVCIPPLAVHETYPGHHTAFLHQRSGAGVAETPPELRERSAAALKNRFFHEGWAQYAEVLMLEQGYYAGEPERELGAWRSLLFRVERARIDALLHSTLEGDLDEGGLSREEAVEALAVFVGRGTAEAEVRRHLEEPGLKAAYYVGLLQVLELRRTARAADPELDLRAFHDRLVRWPLPLPVAARERFGVKIGPGLPTGGLQPLLGTAGPHPTRSDP